MAISLQPITRKTRTFLPNDFVLSTWQDLEPWFNQLLERPIQTLPELEQWLADESELSSYLEEEAGWRYIHMSRDTANADKREAFNYFVSEIEPQAAPLVNELNKKLYDHPLRTELDPERYGIYLRSVKTSIEIYREENVPIQAELAVEQQQFGEINGAMTVDVAGETKTLQQAALELEKPDRQLRENTWRVMQDRRFQDHEALDSLFSRLIEKRHQLAINAGYANYRDYAFDSLQRFDYTVADCEQFHEAIATQVVPLLSELQLARKQALGLDALRPWDLAVDPENQAPLRPFSDSDDLLNKSIAVLDGLGDQMGNYLRVMQAMGHLDLESRIGKAPGGYNYPLDEVGVPFIFMNAAGTLRDVTTLIHEAGHAIHSFQVMTQPLQFFKHPPSEVAELASMSMELLSLNQWHQYLPDTAERNRAIKEHLTDIIETLPWVATIDKFQHWVYTQPTHTLEERKAAWLRISQEFGGGVVDWSGLELYQSYGWQKQLHLFEVPFYYIEYGIAQLGAVGVWRNYQQNPEKALKQYLDALAFGYSKTIGQVYATAGVKLDFSAAYISELMAYVKGEMAAVA